MCIELFQILFFLFKLLHTAYNKYNTKKIKNSYQDLVGDGIKMLINLLN